ncbi:MAG TPA: hypothetical protein VKU19_05590 [Bryobacteraceae bacterium]|nr:hypothetical protein [Bryobacteraceae bacterium]
MLPFEYLVWAAIAIVIAAMICAYDGTRDVFHPLMFLGPMLGFIYGWMPLKLNTTHGLEGFFHPDQLSFVQTMNVLGILALVMGCLSCGTRVLPSLPEPPLSASLNRRLLVGGTLLGLVGLAAWSFSIIEVGGFSEAFGKPYSGGWDDSGYVRDAALLMFPAFLMILYAGIRSGLRPIHLLLIAPFLLPWMVQAFFTARRGPTFMISVLVGMSWYLYRCRRPAIITMVLGGVAIGYFILLLVVNRQSIYLGSDFSFTTDVSGMVEKPDTGNEFIYGTGSLLSAEQRGTFFWGRRYAAQLMVRPIPRAVWPNKYADFGVPELEHNAGTGEGFADALGWNGADGSAPGLIADLWLEFRWLSLPVMWLIGRFYGTVWHKMRSQGGVWKAQYVIISALSIYLVMQTIEAVLFRVIELSVPIWLFWGFARGSRARWELWPVPPEEFAEAEYFEPEVVECLK